MLFDHLMAIQYLMQPYRFVLHIDVIMYFH